MDEYFCQRYAYLLNFIQFCHKNTHFEVFTTAKEPGNHAILTCRLTVPHQVTAEGHNSNRKQNFFGEFRDYD